MADVNEGMIRPVKPRDGLRFDFQVHDGIRWVSLNDHLNFIVGGDSFQSVSQGRKRYTVQSALYDGDWEVHSTASSVTEGITIDVLGSDSIMVAENLDWMRKAFTQSVYNCRKITNDLMETWTCFPAEWAINSGQVFTHHTRAQVKLSVPRFPKINYEAIA